MEKLGRDDLENVAKEIEGKKLEEVQKYAAAFWKNLDKIADGENIKKKIEKGEEKIKRTKDIKKAVKMKLERYKNPARELRIAYGQNKGKAYTEEEDRFLLCCIPKVGYGNWDDLKAEIRKHWLFRFDWRVSLGPLAPRAVTLRLRARLHLASLRASFSIHGRSFSRTP